MGASRGSLEPDQQMHRRQRPTRPFDTRGFSAFSEPARFDENQYLVNIDFLHTERSRLAGRYFQADGDQTTPRTPLKLLGENGNIEFRTELFNAFNTPQFAPPNTNVSTPTFGVISATSVNPRIIQFALS
jgi:hypothetical protein